MSVVIRRLDLEDAPLAGRLMHEYKQSTYAGILPAGRLERRDLDHSIRLCTKLLKDPASRAIFAAFVNDVPAAIAATGKLRYRQNVPAEYDAEFHSFYVVAKFRRSFGVADLLWNARIAWLRDRGMKAAVAIVLAENAPGRAQVERRGGRIIATKRGARFWAGHDLLIYGWPTLPQTCAARLPASLQHQEVRCPPMCDD